MAKGNTGYSKGAFEEALAAEGVGGTLASLAKSIFVQESGGGRDTRTSNANAHGGMQIIPGTFKSVADKGWDISNPEHNMRAGIRYLKQLDKQSGGVPELTAAGYYGGPGGLEKARKGIAVSDPRNPKAPNTLKYGQQVVARMGNTGMGGKAASSPTHIPQAVAPVQAPQLADPRTDPLWNGLRNEAQAPVQEDPMSMAEYGQPLQAPEQMAQAVPTDTPAAGPALNYSLVNQQAAMPQEQVVQAQPEAPQYNPMQLLMAMLDEAKPAPKGMEAWGALA